MTKTKMATLMKTATTTTTTTTTESTIKKNCQKTKKIRSNYSKLYDLDNFNFNNDLNF